MAAGVPKGTTGLDASKKTPGGKRELAVDVLGLTIGVVVRRNPDDDGRGFVPQPKRWVVEQINGTLMLQRRLARDYDHRPGNAASRVYWDSTVGMLRRLAPAWRDDVELAA